MAKLQWQSQYHIESRLVFGCAQMPVSSYPLFNIRNNSLFDES